MTVEEHPYHYGYGRKMLPVRVHSEVPLFWRRVVEPVKRDLGAPDHYVDLRWGLTEPLIIYGYAAASPYEEDASMEKQIWEADKAFPVIAFSIACVEGEHGYVPMNDVVEITEEQFHKAFTEGWV